MSVIVPGSYDPVTNGHLDIIRRAAEENDEVYAVIFVNPDKEYTFSLDDRMRMLILATDDLPNVLVSYSNGLVVDYMRDHDIERIVKGYRGEADLPWEKEQADYNLKHGYETELILCDEKYAHISSTLVRERLKNGDSLEGLVPECIEKYIALLTRS